MDTAVRVLPNPGKRRAPICDGGKAGSRQARGYGLTA